MKKILVIIPFTVDPDLARDHLNYLERNAGQDTALSIVSLENGPRIEDYEALGSEYGLEEILQVVRNAQDEYDGIMISCFEDPGVVQARAISRIPVTGPCESALFIASLQGQPFIVISPDASGEPICRNNVTAMRLDDRFSAFRLVQTDVPELARNEQELVGEICQIIEQAQGECPGTIAILGCTAFGPLHPTIAERVQAMVIDPAATAIALLETAIDARQSSLPNAGWRPQPEAQP